MDGRLSFGETDDTDDAVLAIVLLNEPFSIFHPAGHVAVLIVDIVADCRLLTDH
jgi:hypothetical protein